MKFTSVQEAFNHYRTMNREQIESRAREIRSLIDTDPSVDMETINIELDGLKQAKENLEERSRVLQTLNPITGAGFAPKLPEGDVFESKEYRSAFYKSMLGQELTAAETLTFNRAMELQETEKRSDQFNTMTNSAAVLPTTTLNEVIQKARKMGGLLGEIRAFTIPTNIKVPIGTPQAKANWHTEGAAVQTEKLDTVTVDFGAYEIIKIFSISAAARKMTISAFENYLIEELTSCVMECIADAVVNGTGTSQGTGLMSGVAWDTSNSFTFPKAAAPTYKDFTKMMAMLKRGYAAGAKWAMNNATLYNLVYGLTDTNGRPIFIADPKNESVGFLLGKPVVIDDNIGNDIILLGNFNYMAYNMPQGIMLEVSTQSGFKSGLIDYRAMAIADTKPLIGEAFIKMSRAQ